MFLFQEKVRQWTVSCFGEEIALDKAERNHRFLEESLELVQSAGCTKEECLQLVDYVYGRPAGEMKQEVGGVAITLNALCNAHDINLEHLSNVELNRVWEKIDKIREKQKNKPKFSPLPE